MTARRPVQAMERAIYIASGVVVVGVAAWAIGLDVAGGRGQHPTVTIQVDGEPWADGSITSIPWVVENSGTVDIEAVQVEVRRGDAHVVQDVDYLPRGARQRGVARFAGGSGEPSLAVVAYRLP